MSLNTNQPDMLTMATFEITIDDEKIQDLLQSDRGMATLLEPILNQLLQAEMTEHLQAERGRAHCDRVVDGATARTSASLPRGSERSGWRCPAIETAPSRPQLFERYQRSEKALVLALMQMVVQGVSTRRVMRITSELCGREFSWQTVSRLAEGLDEQVTAWAERSLTAWAERSLEGRSYPFLVLDAMQTGDDTSPKVRRQGAVRATTVLLAVGISEEGYREVLGLEIALGETGEAWRRFIQQLKARGLSGVEVATSDAHEGLRQALEAAFPGLIWQRCHTEEFLGVHFRRNVLDRTPIGLRDRMHELLDQILTAPSPERAREAFGEA